MPGMVVAGIQRAMRPFAGAFLLFCATGALAACTEEKEAFPFITPPPNLEADLLRNCIVANPQHELSSIRLTMDDTHVYWTARPFPTARRASKDGGPVEPIAFTSDGWADGIAVDATRVYLGSPVKSALESSPKDGEAGAVLSSDHVEGGVFSVAVDDAYVYWSVHGSFLIRRMPKGGGGVEIISDEEQYATSLALDDDYVYWGVTANQYDPDSSWIRRAPKGGGEAETFAAGLGACPSLALDDEYVYWVTRVDCRVQRAPKQGGPAVTVAEAPPGGRCFAIAVDGTDVFWASGVKTRDAPAAVWRAPKEGGVRTLLAWEDDVYGLALDETYVYFPSGDSFRRVPK